jgi:hypothetical protein
VCADCPELLRFTRGELDARKFAHREHVRMGYELLRRVDFAHGALLYSQALRRMSANAGVPQAFNQTMTIAFLALIGEAIAQGDCADFAHFERAHPQLFERGVLNRWYCPQRLANPLARSTFLLPDPYP